MNVKKYDSYFSILDVIRVLENHYYYCVLSVLVM